MFPLDASTFLKAHGKIILFFSSIVNVLTLLVRQFDHTDFEQEAKTGYAKLYALNIPNNCLNNNFVSNFCQLHDFLVLFSPVKISLGASSF